MSGPSAPAIWEARNLVVAGVLAPLLVLTGALGFALPPDWALLSGVPAYNLFHIAGGLVGIALVLGSGGRGAIQPGVRADRPLPGRRRLDGPVPGRPVCLPAPRRRPARHPGAGPGGHGSARLGPGGGRRAGGGRRRPWRARDRGDLGVTKQEVVHP